MFIVWWSTRVAFKNTPTPKPGKIKANMSDKMKTSILCTEKKTIQFKVNDDENEFSAQNEGAALNSE